MPPNPVLNDKRFEEVIAAGYGTAPVERPMTIGGTLSALAVLFVLLLGAAAYGWSQVQQTVSPVLDAAGDQVLDASGQVVTTNSTTLPGWLFIVLFVALGFAFATIFLPKFAFITAPLYALAEGAVLGAISAVYNMSYDGIVVQAIAATLGVVLVMFLLYATRIVKVTPKYVLITIAATGGIFVMYMATWILSIFGLNIAFWNSPTPLGIGISVVIVIVAAMNLAIDFAFIERSAKSGDVPRRMEWLAAFGVTVTIVWLYLEILRLLSLLRR